MKIRAEMSADVAAIRALHVAAFPTAAEADLVERLRSDGDAAFSLVAIHEEQVIGHVLFSRMRAPADSLGLAPVAVLASQRGRGVAETLIRHGLERAKCAGWKWVFVLGGEYYRRFGFDPALAGGFTSRYAGPHLMGLALQPDESSALGERLEYAGAFEEME